jgi:hypothetical protein
MPNLLYMLLLAEGFSADWFAQQAAGALDLVGLAVGIWTVWSSISLPLGGKLQRAFRLIGLGALAFAFSHLLDTLIAGLRLLSNDQGFLLTQGTVLISMLLFVSGVAGLADVVPTLPSAGRVARFPRFWPLAVTAVMMIGAFSFILYGLSPEAEVIALFGLDGGITVLAVLCLILLARSRIGGMIGRFLWLAMAGLLIFSLAHPLQAWLYNRSSLPGNTLAILHRLIVMPSLLIFAYSITRLARKLSVNLYIESTPTSRLPVAQIMKPERRKVKDGLGPRARARRKREREERLSSPVASRPFPALKHRSGKS